MGLHNVDPDFDLMKQPDSKESDEVFETDLGGDGYTSA